MSNKGQQPSGKRRPRSARNSPGRNQGGRAQRVSSAKKSHAARPTAYRSQSKTARFMSRYKRLFLRLSWPLRILLLVATVAIATVAAHIALNLLALVFVLFAVLGLFGGGGRKHGSSWQKEADERWQDMMDDEQRRHENEGRV
ncbi:MAG TPA: hypothetical protein VFZ58_01435 [Candidatus Saccharimonadales bacterium]